MRAFYVSIQARFLCTLTTLLVVSVVVICAASSVMTTHILVNMKRENLEVQTRTVEFKVERSLSAAYDQIFQTSLTQSIQAYTLGQGAPLDNNELKTFGHALLQEGIVQIRIYNSTLMQQGDISPEYDLVQTAADSSSLYPIESDQQPTMRKIMSTGMAMVQPYAFKNATNTAYAMSITMPVFEADQVSAGPKRPYDLIKNSVPIYGFLTGIIDCSLWDMSVKMEDGDISVSMGTISTDEACFNEYFPIGKAKNFVWGSRFPLEHSVWTKLLEGRESTSEYGSGIVSVAPLEFENFAVLLHEPSYVVGNSRNSLTKALIICACISVVVGFIVLFLANRWRTRNLVNVIKATEKRKRALDESRKDTGNDRGDMPTEASSTLSCDQYYQAESPNSINWTDGLKKRRGSDEETDPQTLSNSLYRITQKAGPITIKDEGVDMSLRIDSIFEALIHQYKVLEDRVLERKHQISEAKRVADEANAAKSHFLARVTHELRTPLNGILGTASLCMDEEDISQVHTSLKTIYKCGELLLHLLTDLLSFSQSEIENVELDEQEFMINEVTTQIMAIFREQTEKGRMHLDMNIDPGCLKLIVYGDLNRILQVIFNLLSNSLKFTPEGGHVEFFIAASKCAESDKRIITFVVKDNGPGIAPHLQSRVFEAFVQGDINNKVRRAGVGLGLSICKQLAERMGGSITLESELGHGCTFTFAVALRYVSSEKYAESLSTPTTDGPIWPEYEHYNTGTIMRKAEAELGVSRKLSSLTTPTFANLGGINTSPHACDPHMARANSSSNCSVDGVESSSSSERGSTSRPPLDRGISMKGSRVDPDLRVLVADDNKVNQEVMIRMLNLEGLSNISVADDGLEAVEKTKAAIEAGEMFDIIFMDVQMPNCDGKKATQILRSMNVTIPIVAVSAYANEENIEACLQSGMNLFLGKPLRRPSLHKLLEGLQDANDVPDVPAVPDVLGASLN